MPIAIMSFNLITKEMAHKKKEKKKKKETSNERDK